MKKLIRDQFFDRNLTLCIADVSEHKWIFDMFNIINKTNFVPNMNGNGHPFRSARIVCLALLHAFLLPGHTYRRRNFSVFRASKTIFPLFLMISLRKSSKMLIFFQDVLKKILKTKKNTGPSPGLVFSLWPVFFFSFKLKKCYFF